MAKGRSRRRASGIGRVQQRLARKVARLRRIEALYAEKKRNLARVTRERDALKALTPGWRRALGLEP